MGYEQLCEYYDTWDKEENKEHGIQVKSGKEKKQEKILAAL